LGTLHHASAHAAPSRRLGIVHLGDTEILDRLRERCQVTDTHPAGVTCLMGVDQTHHTATG
jgi:hypothetical protein